MSDIARDAFGRRAQTARLRECAERCRDREREPAGDDRPLHQIRAAARGAGGFLRVQRRHHAQREHEERQRSNDSFIHEQAS
jgi:hypothetical protein